MVKEGLGTERTPRDPLHQLLTVHRPAQRPDGFRQPGLEPGLLTGPDQGLDRALPLFERLGELGADQMAQGIGGEIAEQTLKSVPDDVQTV
jgi:hypothetical protein